MKHKKEFIRVSGKISETRDGGLGLGGGKLQRDALCTRGRQGKAPYSNRNLRWHPLVVAETPIPFAKEIDHIEIEGENDAQTLIFVIRDNDERLIKYPSEKVHELPERYVVLPKHWIDHINTLKYWNDTQWTQNSCVITAFEACEWQHAVESYAVLAISVAVVFYGVSFRTIYPKVTEILRNQNIDRNISLPSRIFPTSEIDFISCPLCKTSIAGNPSNLDDRERISVWQPAWRSTKRREGEDSSIQIMHISPLVESEQRHNAKNVRYGHRWCNVAMTDHSLDETLDFMEYIVKAHNRCRK
ncbi:MAG TPA: hypothetical protein PLG90_11370 [Ignavibacteria bacterium]|nr:hypothetical protein [Ignavibacteria bacterium]